jgi:hypothetical protein
MKRTFILGTVLSLLISALASAAPCPTATLDVYLSSFATLANACTVDNKEFWGFVWTPTATGGAGVPLASTVTVTPVTNDPSAGSPNAGFNFQTPSLTLNADGQSIDALLKFKALDLSGAAISDSHLSLIGAASPHFANASGPIINISEQNCGGPTIASTLASGCSGLSDQFVSLVNKLDGTPQISSNAFFAPPVTFVDIAKDIALSTTGPSCTGAVNCSASVSQFTEVLTQVPEPGSLILLTTVMLGVLATMGRRRSGIS